MASQERKHRDFQFLERHMDAIAAKSPDSVNSSVRKAMQEMITAWRLLRVFSLPMP